MSKLTNTPPTMSSVELVDVINDMRASGRAVLEHSDFMKKVKNHPGIDAGKFSGVYVGGNGQKRPCYYLPKRECELMVMSESLEVQTRVYDRLMEKEAAVTVTPPTRPQFDSAMRALKLAPLAVKAARALGLDKNAAAISANQFVCTLTGENLLEGFGHTHLLAENQETQWFTPTELGVDLKISGQKLNTLLEEAGFQTRRGKVWELLSPGRQYARLHDTGKKHKSGLMVQQIRWSPAVLAALGQGSAGASQGNLLGGDQ